MIDNTIEPYKIELLGVDYTDLEIPANYTGDSSVINNFLDELLYESENEFQKYTINCSNESNSSNRNYNMSKPLPILAYHQNAYIKDSIFQCQGVIGIIRNKSFEHNNNKYDISLKIHTRFDENEQKCFFTAELIRCYAEKYLDISLSESEIPVESEKLLDFLKICIFRKHVLEAYKVGFYKKYTYFQGNDYKLRGRIDIARHIKENFGLNNGKIAYEYRENTVDNAVNHLILKTWLELKKEFPDMTQNILSKDFNGLSAENMLKQLQYIAPGFTQKSLRNILKEANIPVTSTYFSEYENLREICIKILNGLSHSLYTGAKETGDTVESLLFYVPDLWEIYVSEILKKIYPDKYLIEQGETPVLTVPNENKCLLLNYPDFQICDNLKKTEAKLVLDAKFKPAWSTYKNDSAYLSESMRNDIRQVLTYGELTAAQNIGVIFPIDPNINSETFVDNLIIGKRTDNVHFLVCGIKIPSIKGLDFSTWKKKLDKEVNILKELLPQI